MYKTYTYTLYNIHTYIHSHCYLTLPTLLHRLDKCSGRGRNERRDMWWWRRHGRCEWMLNDLLYERGQVYICIAEDRRRVGGVKVGWRGEYNNGDNSGGTCCSVSTKHKREGRGLIMEFDYSVRPIFLAQALKGLRIAKMKYFLHSSKKLNASNLSVIRSTV